MAIDNRSLSTIDEPACWGSGELPFLPPAWEKALQNRSVDGLVRLVRKKRQIHLSDFCGGTWPKLLVSCVTQIEGDAIYDLVIESLVDAISDSGDFTEVPIVAEQLAGVPGARGLPFLLETWDVLASRGMDSDERVTSLLQGTHFDAFELLGDWIAVLDIAITAEAWLVRTTGKPPFFARSICPTSMNDAFVLARIRSARQSGIVPTSPLYSFAFADALGRRRAITDGKPWTLEQCGTALNLTRERVRQIEKGLPWEARPRRWKTHGFLERAIEDFRLSRAAEEFSTFDSEGRPIRINCGGFKIMCAFLGAGNDSRLNPAPSLHDRLASIHLKLSDLKREAYKFSLRLGFLNIDDLRYQMTSNHPDIDETLCEEVIREICEHTDLPFDYVYVEGMKNGFFFNWISSLLSSTGPLGFEELYLASTRQCQGRIPSAIHPVRRVIRQFFELDSRFLVDNGTIRLVEPEQVKLGKTQAWMMATIKDAPGVAIHRTELLSRAREVGFNRSSVGVFCSYSMYFKPVGRNCVSLTGEFPSEEAIDAAHARGASMRIATSIDNWKAVGGVVDVHVTSGTDLCDSGLLGMKVVLMRLLGTLRYKIMVGDAQYGHVGWTKQMSTGWTTALNELGVVSGDEIVLSFDSKTKEVLVTFAKAAIDAESE